MTLTQGQGQLKHCPLHHVTYVSAKFEVATANSEWNAFTRKYIVWTWPKGQGGQGHTICCPVPSTSCDLCTSKVWCCYIPWFRRRCIYKKIHYLTLVSWSHKILPSIIDIMWPMHQQSLMLLHPTVKEKKHLQENTLFDLDLGVKVTWNVVQCPLHHVTYAPTEFEMHLQENSLLDLWPWGVKVTQNVAQYPLHHVIFSATKFEVTMSNGLGGDTFTRKYIIWHWPLGQSHMKCCPVPSTSCDLFSYKVWSC